MPAFFEEIVLPTLNEAQIRQFEADGYLIVEDAFNAKEVAQIRRIVQEDPKMAAEAKTNHNYDEGEDGLGTRLVNRSRLIDDVFSACVRSRRIVDPLEQLLGDEVCHYYHLTMLKNANTGGWQWHQDYGYHYKEFFYPDLVSVMVALDPATRDNGCLRVVRGSHRVGRLEHWDSGSQLIADPERVETALREMEEVHCEMTPGSVLYFHGNVLHASHPNLSSQPRWAFIFAYVGASNVIVLPDAPDDLLTRIDKLDDAEVAAAIARHLEEIEVSST